MHWLGVLGLGKLENSWSSITQNKLRFFSIADYYSNATWEHTDFSVV